MKRIIKCKICKKHKNVLYWTFSYFNFCAVSGCISISSFDSLRIIPIGITSSAIELKIV